MTSENSQAQADGKRQRPLATPKCLRPRIPSAAFLELEKIFSSSGDRITEVLQRRAKEIAVSRQEHSRSVQALFLLLNDLCRQGWKLDVRPGEIWAVPPNAIASEGETLTDVKNRLRHSLLRERSIQLADPAVRDFLRRMETRRLYRGKRVSILDLIDDGSDLAPVLSEIGQLPPSLRSAALSKLIRPEICCVTAEAKCEFTGLSLTDVWRYFRHTWSLEYRPTPGRTLLILLRNAARPNAPIIGIGALANALPQLRVRDEWIGWTTDAVLRTLREKPDSWAEIRLALLQVLDEARRLVRVDDLKRKVGNVTGEALETRLLAVSAAAAKERKDRLRERERQRARGNSTESLRRLPTDRHGNVDWRQASESPLFVRKRAKVLADVLFANRILQTSRGNETESVSECFQNADFVRAIAIALREVRKIGLASRLLEVNVCGAVPPYRSLLGGKLVALALASEEVADFYRKRYRRHVSEIASQIAGRAVIRAPRPCVLTTTSLYGIATSQYNRLRVNLEGPRSVAWAELGLTEGFGTVHLGADTVRVLRQFTIERRGGRNVNNVFGEGNSARLRQVREGLEELGIESDLILQHSTPRIVYGLELYHGARHDLLLNRARRMTQPSFIEITDAWRDRWLVNRVTNRDAVQTVSEQGPASVRRELAKPNDSQLSIFDDSQTISAPSETSEPQRFSMVRTTKKEQNELVQSLYRDISSCADHHDKHTVELLHVETPVEQFVSERALNGDLILVTGNPGDGKTHLIRRIDSVLSHAKVEICLDANEKPDSEVMELIESSFRKKRGTVVAINQGILVDLLRFAEHRPWAEEVWAQLLRPFVYRDVADVAEKKIRIFVCDLNHRNNLGPHVVLAALSKITSLVGRCGSCPSDACRSMENARRLSNPKVAARVALLLDRVSRAGYHATMRDLQGYLSFLIFGGSQCATDRPYYWTNAFEGGVGTLFDAVREFDPSNHPSALFDDTLWRHADNANDWIVSISNDLRVAGSLPERRQAFVARKRRAFFEHVHGEACLQHAGSHADRVLLDSLDPAKASVTSIVLLLNRFFDRDEQRGDLLYLWTTHRFDARPNRFAAALWHVPATMLELCIPKLRSDIGSAFPEFRPDHAFLCLKSGRPEDGLRIDRGLVDALMIAEQGLPPSFRSGEPEARIAGFFDRLAKNVADVSSDNRAEVRFVDMDTGANLQLAVDIKHRKYLRHGVR